MRRSASRCFDHALDVKVLEHHYFEAPGQFRGKSMLVEVSRPGDSSVEALVALQHLRVVIRTLQAARQLAIELGEANQLSVKMSGILDVAVLVTEVPNWDRQGGQVLDPDVDPHEWADQSYGVRGGYDELSHRKRSLPTTASERDRHGLDGAPPPLDLVGQVPPA